VLKAAHQTDAFVPKNRAELLADVEKLTGVLRPRIFGRSRDRGTVRAIYCYLCREKARVSGTDLKLELGISHSAVSKLIAKGQKLLENEQNSK